MTRTNLILILMIAVMAHEAMAQIKQSDPQSQTKVTLESEVKSLVADLGKSDFQTRERANKRLISLGAKAFPFLQSFRDHKDLEVRTRVRALLEGDQEDPKPLRKIEGGDEKSNPRKLRKGVLKKRDSHLFEDLLNGKNGSQRFRFDFPAWDRDLMGQSRFRSMTSMQMGDESLKFEHSDDGVKLTVTTRDQTEESRVFEAKTMEEFKKAFPQEYERYKNTGIFENARVEFQVLNPGAPRLRGGFPQGMNQEMNDHFERLFKFLDRDLSERRFGAFNLEELDGDLDQRLRAFFERTRRGPGVFDRDPFFGPRLGLKRLSPESKKKVLGVEVSLPPIRLSVDLEKSGVGDKGIYVNSVVPNSLAAQVGLKVGDVLLSLNGDEISKPLDLKTSFLLSKPNDKLVFSVWREGKLLTLTGSMPGLPKSKKEDTRPQKLHRLPDVKKL